MLNPNLTSLPLPLGSATNQTFTSWGGQTNVVTAVDPWPTTVHGGITITIVWQAPNYLAPNFFGCSFATGCTVNGVSASLNSYRPYDPFPYSVPREDLTYYDPGLPSLYANPFVGDGKTTVFTVVFTVANLAQSYIWSQNTNAQWPGFAPEGSYGCAFFAAYGQASDYNPEYGYPFNYIAGLQPNENLRNQLSCTPCASCERT